MKGLSGAYFSNVSELPNYLTIAFLRSKMFLWFL